MRTISFFIKFDGQELTRPPRQRQALQRKDYKIIHLILEKSNIHNFIKNWYYI
jgi:hypothetical protein